MRALRLCNPPALQLCLAASWPAISKRSHPGFRFIIDEYPDRTNTVCMSSSSVAKVSICFQPCKYFPMKMYNNINRRHAHKRAVCKRPQNALPKTVFGNTKGRLSHPERRPFAKRFPYAPQRPDSLCVTSELELHPYVDLPARKIVGHGILLTRHVGHPIIRIDVVYAEKVEAVNA